METNVDKLRQAKEFASNAGVTVRTLHLYDRLGLLKPAARTDSDRAKLGERISDTPKDAVEKGQRDWAELIAEVEQAASEQVDPASDRAQGFAERWRDLIQQFTRGDGGIQKGLNRLYSDSAHWPADFKRPWSDEADALIKNSMNCSR